MFPHLVNHLSNSIHEDRPKSREDLPCIVEEDNVLGGGDICNVDVAGHQSNRDSGKQSGQDETGDLVGGEEEDSPAGNVGDGGKYEHPSRSDQLLKKATKHGDDNLCIVFRGTCKFTFI